MGLCRGKLSGKRKRGWLYCTAAAVLLGMALIAGFAGERLERRGGLHQGEALQDDRLSVVTTIFPYYDFVRQVAGDRVKLKLIVPAGMDSHSFEPTPADVAAMEQADVLICNGGGMEQWVYQVLDSLDTSHMKVLTMMDYVDVVEEEHVEGMEDGSHTHEDSYCHEDSDVHEDGYTHEDSDVHEDGYTHKDSHTHKFDCNYTYKAPGGKPGYEACTRKGTEYQAFFDKRDGHELEIEYDEHIWTSPVNAQAIVAIISEALCEASPENQEYFQAGRDEYLGELKKLDTRLREVVAQGRHRMIVVADKFPFRYFADEYGLSYRAAFSGCSADTEPSAKTIAYLIDKVREAQIGAVYYLELSSHRTAEIISEETGAKPLLLHSCHNVTRRQLEEGVTYLQLMQGNAENLRKGLE